MRVPGLRTTPAQSTPWPVSSRTARSAHTWSAGRAEISAVRSPSRAQAAATFASAPPNCTSRESACSRRCGGGAASRSITSPSPTRSWPTVGVALPEPQHGAAAEDHRRVHGLDAPVAAEGEHRGLAGARPGRPAGEVDLGMEASGARLLLGLEGEGDDLDPVAVGAHVVRALVLRARAPDDPGPVAAVRRPLQPIGREVEARRDRVVDGPVLGDRGRIVHLPAPAEEEGVAHRVVLDPPALVVVVDRQPVLAPPERLRVPRAHRHEPPTPDDAGHVHVRADAGPVAIDPHPVPLGGPVDLFDHPSLDLVADKAKEYAYFEAVG